MVSRVMLGWRVMMRKLYVHGTAMALLFTTQEATGVYTEDFDCFTLDSVIGLIYRRASTAEGEFRTVTFLAVKASIHGDDDCDVSLKNSKCATLQGRQAALLVHLCGTTE
jgi:hypothetical protein